MLDVCLLGTGGMMPMPDRWLSSLLLRTRGHTFLIDCGEGTQISWKMTGWGFNQTDAIILTHRHADHTAGLPGILYSLAHAMRTDPVTIYGPHGIESLVTSLRAIVPRLPFELTVTELYNGDVVQLPGELEMRALEVSHHVPCLAYSFSLERTREFQREIAEARNIPVQHWSDLKDGADVEIDGVTFRADDVLGPPRAGIKVSFVTDTRPTSELPEFVRGSDLLICEGMYGSEDERARADERGHMVFPEAAEIARRGQVKKLWLTHFSPALQNPWEHLTAARYVFPETYIGVAHETLTIPFPEVENNDPSDTVVS
jgi:ribonuclease Z